MPFCSLSRVLCPACFTVLALLVVPRGSSHICQGIVLPAVSRGLPSWSPVPNLLPPTLPSSSSLTLCSIASLFCLVYSLACRLPHFPPPLPAPFPHTPLQSFLRRQSPQQQVQSSPESQSGPECLCCFLTWRRNQYG